MRFSLLASLLVALSACDSAALSASDPLIGTWELVESATETRVTSQVDQSLPDFSARGDGQISVTGAVTADLRYVLYSIHQDGTEEVAFGEAPSFPAFSDPFVSLSVGSAPAARAILNARRNETDERYSDDDTATIDYADGRFDVVARALQASDGSGRQARAEGTLTFPLVSLRAGREATVETRQEEATPRTVTFAEGGIFTQISAEGSSLQGTWTAGPGGALELRYGTDPPDYRFQSRARYVVDGGALRVSLSPDSGCTEECVPAYAASRYADPASLAAVRYVTVESYQRLLD